MVKISLVSDGNQLNIKAVRVQLTTTEVFKKSEYKAS